MYNKKKHIALDKHFSAPTKVAINARFLEKNLKGIGRYSLGIAKGLRNKDSAFVLLSSKAILPKFEDYAKKLGVRRINHFRSHLWEQVVLPKYLTSIYRPLLVNFVNTAPISYDNQITVIHDLAFKKAKRSLTKIYRKYYNFIIPRAINASKKIVTVSHTMKKEIIKEYNLNTDFVEVVYNFVSGNIVSLSKKRQYTKYFNFDYILAVSSLNPRKNFKRLLRAFSSIKSNKVKLLIVGEKKRIFKAEDFGNLLNNNIIFTGFVKDEVLVDLYKHAIIFIYPSFYEGFGIPILEAMQCDCPVITSCTSSMPEVAGDAAILINPYDVDDISNAISELLTNESLRKDLKIKGKKNLHRFTFSSSVEQFYKIIKKEL